MPKESLKRIRPVQSAINGGRRAIRDELLNEALFFGLEHARHAIAEWTEDYNTGRPHSALDYQTPAAFAAKLTPSERAYSCRDSNPRWGILQWHVINLQWQLTQAKIHIPSV